MDKMFSEWGLLAFISIGLILCWEKSWRHKLRLVRWRKALRLKQHEKTYRQLYAYSNGFALSQAARQEQDALEYVYGEIDFESFIALMSLCKPSSSTCFYDLGSGIGKTVLACAMVFNVKKSCGLELFPSLVQCAEKQKQRLKEIPDYQGIAQHIEFQQADIQTACFKDATLVFINATAFFGETWLTISKQLEQIKPGSLVISTSKPLRSELFLSLHTTQAKMSWGIVEAYIQQRQDKKSSSYAISEQ